MLIRSVNSNDAALCPRCKGDGAVLTHIPNETESQYGWAGYVPCPRCGGCGHDFAAAGTAMAGPN